MIDSSFPFFSIIVPVYNTEEHLSQCLESIISQSFDNWEAIVINDGSTDRSPEICDEYKSKDARFLVTHQSNFGQSCARNAGIERVKGEWILYLDSDDYIDSDMLEKLYLFIKRHKHADIMNFGFRRVKEGKMLTEGRRPEENEISAIEYIRGWNYQHAGCCYVWRASVVKENNLRFMEKLKYAEDQELLSRFFLTNPKLAVLPIISYNYRYNDASITSQKQITIEWCEAYLKAADNTLAWAESKDMMHSPVLIYLLTEFYDQFIAYYYSSTTLNKDEGREIYRKYYDDLCIRYPNFQSIKRFKRFYISDKLFHRYSKDYNKGWIYVSNLRREIKKCVLNKIFHRHFIPYRLEL